LRRVAERHPGLQLIVDHMGLTLSAQAVREGKVRRPDFAHPESREIPNVSVKLSATPNYSLQPYPFRDMTRTSGGYPKRTVPRRCHWGSDITNGF